MGPGIRDGKWKYYLQEIKGKKTGGEELYDILNDPGESKNLAKQYPEVIGRLREKTLGWNAQLPKHVLKTGKYRHQY